MSYTSERRTSRGPACRCEGPWCWSPGPRTDQPPSTPSTPSSSAPSHLRLPPYTGPCCIQPYQTKTFRRPGTKRETALAAHLHTNPCKEEHYTCVTKIFWWCELVEFFLFFRGCLFAAIDFWNVGR